MHKKNQRKITEFFKVKPKVSTDKEPKEKEVITKTGTEKENMIPQIHSNTNIFNTIISKTNTKLTNQGINFIFRYLGVFYCLKDKNKQHWDTVLRKYITTYSQD